MTAPKRRTVALGGAVLLGLGACAGHGGGSPAATEPAYIMCEDLAPVSAPASAYSDEPVYVGNEQPHETVLAWAEQQPGFEEMWIDRDHHGWLTLGFSSGAQDRQRDVAALFPDDGVVAVEVPHSAAELGDLADRIAAELPAGQVAGLGPAVHLGVVTVDLGYLTEDRLALMTPYEGEPICVSGRPPSDMVEPGDQPTAGEGWQLLGHGLTGATYRTGVATTAAQYERLWADAGLTGAAPDVDLTSHIVVWFGAVYGSGCPLRLDDVVADHRAALVHAEIVLPTNPSACPDDANPHAFVVAVDRAVLPPGPFAVQLGPDDPPAGVPEERTLVDADLSVPGATATDEQIGVDPELLEASGRPRTVRSGGVVETGFPALYSLTVDPVCGVRFLGTLNDVAWVSDDVGDVVPAAWLPLVVEGGVEVEVLMSTDPAALTASAGGHTVVYRPVRSGEPACG